MRSRRGRVRRICASVLVGILISPFAAAAPVESDTALPPPADFFLNPDVAEQQLSPSGRYLGILSRGDSGRIRLVVMDLASPGRGFATASFDNADIRTFHWVNENRLVFDVFDASGEMFAAGLFATDRDGSNVFQLGGSMAMGPLSVSMAKGKFRSRSGPYSLFHSTTHDGSDDIIVAGGSAGARNRPSVVLYRLNTRTGEYRNLTMGQPPGVLDWILDRDDSPRIAIAHIDGRRIVYERGKDPKEWTVLGDYDEYSPSDFVPRFFGSDGALYVEKDSAGALFRFDLAQHRFDDEPMLKLVGYDLRINPEIDWKARKTVGYHYLTDTQGTAWLDSRFAEYQKIVDAALTGMVNTITCGDCLESERLLIRSSSDRQPPRFYVLNPASKTLLDVGSSRPKIKPSQMGRREFVHYAARDGLPIPAYVTRPPGADKGPWPAIVLVHGGPWVRGGSWEWDPEAQFLASRGYVVIQPEFRGSTGFGFKHFRAGWKQWGLAMQDDLADAARWAVAQGIADPKRIAIIGASYGGYAALMGLVKNPEIFRCAVEWVGVTDIDLLYTVTWSDLSDAYLRYGAPVLIGDPDKDAEQLKATSPLQNAKRITQPILMAYGFDDRRVPIVHGENLRSSIATPRDQVEWIVYKEEGHGWFKEEDRIDFWTRVEKFLDKYLKSAADGSGAPKPQ